MANTLYIVAGLSDADMIWLLSTGSLKRLRGGERPIQAGKPVGDLFFVTQGSLAVVLPDGTQVATLEEGAVFGEMSFIESRPPSATVRAEGKGEILAIPRDRILERFEQEPRFAARFYRALALFLSERLRETTATANAPRDADADAQAAAGGERFRRALQMLRGKA
ncbi:MAG: cyclic nucleotide-binding domain-containing protein [Sphingomonadaceae bacterium]|nr:cyclic nucleotide-binding domain-containing protein [Sphingomonadaceae bacterium]